MRKLTLFCSVTDREGALDSIQRLGVVHLNHVQSPQGADIEQARHESERLRRAFEALPRPRRSAPPSGRAADQAVREIMRLIQEKADLEE